MKPIWIVDDDPSIRFVLEKALAREQLPTRSFVHPKEVLEAFESVSDQASVLVSDIRMPGGNGLQLLEQVHEDHPQLPVIIMTAYSDLDSAVSAFQRGAFEYLPKPFDLPKAVELIKRAVQQSESQAPELSQSAGNGEMLGQAPAMQDVFRAIGRLSQSNVTVMVTGESGSGKSMIANAIMGLLHRPKVEPVAGEILFDGKDLLRLSEDQLRELRGSRMAMVFQEPMTSLNPVLTVGEQIAESVRLHKGLGKAAALAHAQRMLELVEALGELAKPYGAWVRLHYVYPYPTVDAILPLMAQGLVLPYLDVPLQHSHPDVLKRMKRPASGERNLERIREWRAICPELVIRSTFIAGFPGETEEEFEHLLDFIREAEIDRAGCFAYSPVEGATANELPGMLPAEVREARRARFMEVAEEVSAKRLERRVGQTMQVLVDKAIGLGKKGGIARTYADAPEIDGVVHLLPPEKRSQGHDLVGVPV